MILELLASSGRGLKVLDVGCSSGLLSQRIRELGHYVVGVDIGGATTDVFSVFGSGFSGTSPTTAGRSASFEPGSTMSSSKSRRSMSWIGGGTDSTVPECPIRVRARTS